MQNVAAAVLAGIFTIIGVVLLIVALFALPEHLFKPALFYVCANISFQVTAWAVRLAGGE